MEGLYNKENLFAEFAMKKTNADKVKFLQEMKELKKSQPHMFRGTSITQKNFDNLIEEWSKPQPWVEVNRAIKERNRIINSVEGEDVKLNV
jgi:hypothetical protein|tara:strand:+ start:38 stop:310 length:273 start_codon:yes stop_codon:yes gene_type:complete